MIWLARRTWRVGALVMLVVGGILLLVMAGAGTAVMLIVVMVTCGGMVGFCCGVRHQLELQRKARQSRN